MKKNKKLFIIISIIAIVSFIIIISFFINPKKDSFTLSEKEWIEENKNKVIDISILSDIPVLTYNGEGLLFSFLDDVNNNLGLTFNGNAYKYGSQQANDYVFKIVDKASDKDILILRDNYVLVMKNSYIYHDINDIKNIKVGVLKDDVSVVKQYLDDSNQLVEFENFQDLSLSLKSESQENENNVDGVILLKSLVMKDLVEKDLRISYQFTNFTKDYVLTIVGDDVLNSILKKEYSAWSDKHYTEEYNKYLLSQYYNLKRVSDSEQRNLKSKSYTYGYVKNGIYDSINGSKLKGINNLVLKSFTDFSGLSIIYKEYSDIDSMVAGFESGQIDVFLDNTNKEKFSNNFKRTNSGIDTDLAIISKIDNNIVIDSLYSLKGYNVSIVDSIKYENILTESGVQLKKYKNIEDLLNNLENDDIAIIDLENYNYYRYTLLKDYKLDYIYSDGIYEYCLNSDDINFYNLFNFYTNYTSTKQVVSDGYNQIAYRVVDYFVVLVIVSVLFLIVLFLLLINKGKKLLTNKKKRRKVNLSKTDKLKYIDQLTSLKNRAYLNSKIDAWDNSEVYPQAIIIIDLNNIAYINDNYGREEGDRIIVEAANILINSQLPNSEIIRTDGNEFLIYLVGYNEKNVISYLRGLSREFKKLSHGFGAASGYSMINDGIKTVDDAVNEATIDMKNNKEDIDY